ncbi:MAG: hypothetical protein NC828_05960, partial [Candidatus Omnitrophica bacterium]|nr:hypothetical protein [Candidatus Omnitrophota bacterium]
DADEVLSLELQEKIKSLEPNKFSGYRIKRNTYIFNRLFKYGGHAYDYPLRLFNKRKGARFHQPIHESLKISGEIGFIKEPILHYSFSTINEYLYKLNLYTDLEARFLQEKNVAFSWYAMFFRPLAKFFQRYFLQLGFLDGKEGFIFYALSGMYEFVKWAKYWQQTKNN